MTIRFERLAAMLEWKYGLVADTTLVGDKMAIDGWRHKSIAQPDEAQIALDFKEYEEHMASIAYQEKRRKEYPPIGDQLDMLMKYMATIDGLPSDAQQVVDKVMSVKLKYPKPS